MPVCAPAQSHTLSADHERVFQDLRFKVHDPFTSESVIPTMFSLATKLDSHLGSYDLLVGEDTSGRLPALFVRQLVNKRRAAQGAGPAVMRFLYGQWDGAEVPANSYYPEEWDETSRALIVSEHVISGDSIRRVYNTVSRQRLPHQIDVAVLGSDIDAVDGFDPGTRFLCGDRIARPSIDFYFTGAYFKNLKGIHGPRGAQPAPSHAQRLPQGIYAPLDVKAARGDVQRIADTLYPMLPGS